MQACPRLDTRKGHACVQLPLHSSHVLEKGSGSALNAPPCSSQGCHCYKPHKVLHCRQQGFGPPLHSTPLHSSCCRNVWLMSM